MFALSKTPEVWSNQRIEAPHSAVLAIRSVIAAATNEELRRRPQKGVKIKDTSLYPPLADYTDPLTRRFGTGFDPLAVETPAAIVYRVVTRAKQSPQGAVIAVVEATDSVPSYSCLHAFDDLHRRLALEGVTEEKVIPVLIANPKTSHGQYGKLPHETEKLFEGARSRKLHIVETSVPITRQRFSQFLDSLTF